MIPEYEDAVRLLSTRLTAGNLRRGRRDRLAARPGPRLRAHQARPRRPLPPGARHPPGLVPLTGRFRQLFAHAAGFWPHVQTVRGSGHRPGSRSAGYSTGFSAATRMAAPTMPASFSRAAGTILVPTSMCGTHLSAFRLAPPPTMIRSGENRLTTACRYLSTRLAQSFHDSSSRSRAEAAALRSASWPSISMWPSSVFGHELAVEEQPRADPGAERQQQDHARHALAGAVASPRRARRRRRR